MIAQDLGFPHPRLMLEQLTSSEVSELLAYRYMKSDQFKDEEKKRNAAKLLRGQLAHKVKKRAK